MANKVVIYESYDTPVINPRSNLKAKRFKRKMAEDLVRRGLAVKIDLYTYRRTDLAIPSHSSVQSRQGRVYEAAAIDFHPRYVVGGLNRTEIKPAPFSKCKAARVGHQ